MNLLGHHGTSKASAVSILLGNFERSRGQRHYLGEGVYFYQNNIDLAYEWCRAEGNRRDYREYAIIEADIQAHTVFDLNHPSNRDAFHLERTALIDRIRSQPYGVRARNKEDFDGKVVDLMARLRGYQVVVLDTFSNALEDREENLRSRVPNGTEMCVKDMKCIIARRLVEEGRLDERRKKA